MRNLEIVVFRSGQGKEKRMVWLPDTRLKLIRQKEGGQEGSTKKEVGDGSLPLLENTINIQGKLLNWKNGT